MLDLKIIETTSGTLAAAGDVDKYRQRTKPKQFKNKRLFL